MQRVKGCANKTLWRKASGYFAVAVIVSAGLILLTEPDSARSHVATATHADKTGGPTYTEDHRTHWICPANTKCTKLDEQDNAVTVDGWATAYKECPGAADGTCNHRGSPDGWSKNWDYRGHSDEWNYTWRCDAEYKQPEDTDRWGATYKGGSYATSHGKAAQAKPSKAATVSSPSFSWPHCQPKPTLTVYDASALEGGTLEFNIRLDHISGEVQWGTLSDSEADASTRACFSCGENTDLNALTNQRISLTGGVAQKLLVPTIADDRVESNETFKASGYRTCRFWFVCITPGDDTQ